MNVINADAQQHGNSIRVCVTASVTEPAVDEAPVVNACLRLYPAGAGILDLPTDTAEWRSEVDWESEVKKSDLRPIGGNEHTNQHGVANFRGLRPGYYLVVYNNVTPFEAGSVLLHLVDLKAGLDESIELLLKPNVGISNDYYSKGLPQRKDRQHALVGDTLWMTVLYPTNPPAGFAAQANPPAGFRYVPDQPLQPGEDGANEFSVRLTAPGKLIAGVSVRMRSKSRRGGTDDGSDFAYYHVSEAIIVDDAPVVPVTGDITTHASRTETEFTPVMAHWMAIRNSADALSFNSYKAFIDQLFCKEGRARRAQGGADPFEKATTAFHSLEKRRFLPFTDSDSYRVLKAATEAFVMVNCGVLRDPPALRPREDAEYLDRRDLPFDENLQDALLNRYLKSLDASHQTLPYLALIRSKLPDVPIHFEGDEKRDADLCVGMIGERLTNPCMIELIWSYWHEEGMLVQSMNAITRRFQNVRSPAHANGMDPLLGVEIDALRPLNSLLWGHTQDEQHRLSVVRRNYEYDHHYGIRLEGAAVRNFHPADSRSKFVEAFHNLLRQLMPFYRQDDDTTVKADAFPILNALKEVHLILSQGAHNQYGDLPSTARIEMMMMQWILARPEFREFLPTRLMVAYPEPWMDRVDAMKKVQGWSDTSIAHFRDLAMFGEQLLMSIRYSHWSDIYEPTEALNWARFWRPQAQGYIHAYRAVTGVDLSSKIPDPQLEATMPSVLLRRRLEAVRRIA